MSNADGNTFLSVLRELAEVDPDQPALTCGDVTLNRAGFVERVERLAALFAARGVAEGSTVTIGLPNSIGFVESLFAAWAVGAVPQPVSHRLPAPERAAIMDLAKSVTGRGNAAARGGRMAGDRVGAPAASRWLVHAGRVAVMEARYQRREHGPAEADRGHRARPARERGWAGPSGGPAVRRVRPDDGPLSHNAPFVATAAGLLLGNHLVLMPSFDPAETLHLAEKHQASWLYLVPTMMLRIWRLPGAVRLAADVSSLKVAFHVAAPCPPWLKQASIDWLGPQQVFELYAGTELQAATVITGTEWLAHRGSVGRTVLGEIEYATPAASPSPRAGKGRSGCAGAPVPRPRTGTSAPQHAPPPTAGNHSAT